MRPKTIEGYLYLIRNHILPVLGKVKVSQLRADQVQSLYSLKLEQGLSRRTVQFIHSVLHKTLNQALRWGLVVRNVSDLVDPPTPKRSPVFVWNADQVIQFLNSVKNDRFYTVYVLAVYGSFREGEVLGIHVEDCQGSVVNVSHAVQYLIGKGVVVTEPKTETSNRSVKLPPFASQVLKDYLTQLNKNQGLLFTTSSGKPINPRFLIKKFQEALEVSGLPRITFHQLRHTGASLLLSANVHPKVVQERLGHSSIVLTLNTYSHVMPHLQDEAADKLGDLLSRPTVDQTH